MKKSGILCLAVLGLLFAALFAGFFIWRNENRAPISVTEETVTRPSGKDRININTAAAAELEALPGIGPAIAQRIVQYRQENGPFSSVAEITAVSGIGIATFEQILDYITVEDQP